MGFELNLFKSSERSTYLLSSGFTLIYPSWRDFSVAFFFMFALLIAFRSSWVSYSTFFVISHNGFMILFFIITFSYLCFYYFTCFYFLSKLINMLWLFLMLLSSCRLTFWLSAFLFLNDLGLVVCGKFKIYFYLMGSLFFICFNLAYFLYVLTSGRVLTKSLMERSSFRV